MSGHDEFEYAQRALHLKVFEYVLKPVPQEVLAARPRPGRGSARRAAAPEQYMAWAHDQLERNLPLLREQFLRDWVRGRPLPLEIAEQALFLGRADLRTAAMAVIHVVERALATAPSEERERRLALYAVRSAVEEALASSPRCGFSSTSRTTSSCSRLVPAARPGCEAASRDRAARRARPSARR